MFEFWSLFLTWRPGILSWICLMFHDCCLKIILKFLSLISRWHRNVLSLRSNSSSFIISNLMYTSFFDHLRLLCFLLDIAILVIKKLKNTSWSIHSCISSNLIISLLSYLQKMFILSLDRHVLNSACLFTTNVIPFFDSSSYLWLWRLNLRVKAWSNV